MSKLLSVFGATGAQGGALIQHVIQHPILSKAYRLRGITRDVSKPPAVALKDKGVEVVMADMDDPAALLAALSGSYIVFAMTNYWDKVSDTLETAQGKAIADASVAVGATWIIWSSLPDVTRMTGGTLTGVKHFDSKAKVETYIRGLPIKAVFFMPAFYMQNFSNVFRPRVNASGALQLSQSWPSATPIPLIDIRDTGKYLTPILLPPTPDTDRFNHAIITAATAYYTPLDLIAGWRKITGHSVEFVRAESPGLSPEMAMKLKENNGLISQWGYYGPQGRKEVEWTKDLVKGTGETLRDWEGFVRDHEPWF